MAKPLYHHRRKPSNVSAAGGGNGLSFSSGKDSYDDVFSGGLKPRSGGGGGGVGAPGFSSRRVAAEDYAEIFGGKNGTRGSSIPVLDLSELDDGVNGLDDFRASGRKMDYSMIFGGGDDEPSAPVPAFDELFNGVKRTKRNEVKARVPAENGSPLKGPDHHNASDNIKSHSCDGPASVLDGGKQFNMSYHRTGQRRKDILNGTTHIAQLNALPGFTYVIDETARLRDTEQNKLMPPIQSEATHRRSSSDHLQKKELDKATFPVKVEVDSRSPGTDQSDEKFGRRPKWQVPTTKSSEFLVKHKVECNRNDDYPQDKLQHPDDAGLDSHFPKESSPSCSSANLKDSKGQAKQSNISSFGSKSEASEVINGYATFDEELDVNSAAAASVEALRKAIEQAQESIRIAKEKMERKSRPRDSLKASSECEINHALEGNNAKENNVKETGSLEKKVQDPIGSTQESELGSSGSVSRFTQKEKPAAGRHAATETKSENVEASGDNGVTTWFNQLLNNGKQKMAALASELVVKKNQILPPMDKDVDNVREIKPPKESFQSHTTDQVNSVDSIRLSVSTEAKLNVLGSSELNDVDSDSLCSANELRPSDAQISAQNDEAATGRLHGLDREEGGEVETDPFWETFTDMQSALPKAQKDFRESNSPKVEAKSIEQVAGNKLEVFSVGDKNDGRIVEVGNNQKQEEFCLREDNKEGSMDNKDSESKLAADNESDGKRQDHDLKECFDGYDEQESNNQRFAESVELEGNQSFSEEELQERFDRIPEEPCKNEEAGSMDDDADNSSLDKNISVNDKLQENVENPSVHLFEEAVHEQKFDTVLDSYNTNESENLVDFKDSSKSSMENNSEQTSDRTENVEEKEDRVEFKVEHSQQESGKNECVVDNVGATEYMHELDGDDKADKAVEEASCLKGEHVLETASVDQIGSEENNMESTVHDIPDATDSCSAGSTFMSDLEHAGRVSGLEDIGTDGFSSNVIDRDLVNDQIATETSAVDDPSNSFHDLNQQSKIHENDRESTHITLDFEESVHEVGGRDHIESDLESQSSLPRESCDTSSQESAGTVEKDNMHETEREIENDNIDGCTKEQEWVQNEKESEGSHFSGEEDLETNSDGKTDQSSENYEENLSSTFVQEVKKTREPLQKEEAGNDDHGTNEAKKRERERERDRMAVERAIREARERAFAEARERAERAAVEKATAEVRQRAMAEARGKLDKVSSSPKAPVDKASIAAKLRAERAAVERATSEARGRALEKALSQKTTGETKTQSERDSSGKLSGASRDGGLKHSYSSSDLDNFDGTNSESAQRRKARLERHQRIMERAAKALAEKNLRDVLAQREQAQKNRLAETLDAEIKRWASGKEGNLRALLSTLQYILGPGSGWQPISLTEIVTTAAVKKAYRKATLYVHPDKLQQRGASIQQKYICEKVFDLLKAAWNKFNSEER